MKAQRGIRGIVLFFNLGLRWGWVGKAMPQPLYPLERDPVPIVRGLGGPQGQSGRVRKISPPPAKVCLRS